MKRRHCVGRKTAMMHGDNTISQLSSSKVSSNPKERSYSSVRKNDRETSKYNNQQGIHNHSTCHLLRGGAVAPARWEADITPWRRLHFWNRLPLLILAFAQKKRSGIFLCCQAVAVWTTAWPPMDTTRWTPDPAGVPAFWHYQRGASVLSILVDFWLSSRQKK